MKSGGCGILEQYIQSALTNLFSYISFLAFIHTQNASFSCKLLYIHSCVRPACIYVNRILGVLRNAPVRGTIQLPQSSLSLQRVGGIYGTRVYTCPIPSVIQNLCSIVHFEAINIVLAIRTWHQHWANRSIIIWCDNWAVVNAFQSNRIKDIWLMAAVRIVWLYTAAFNINLQVKHIKGVQNTYADILSRWHTYEASELSPVRVLKQCNWEIVEPNSLLPDFSIYIKKVFTVSRCCCVLFEL